MLAVEKVWKIKGWPVDKAVRERCKSVALACGRPLYVPVDDPVGKCCVKG